LDQDDDGVLDANDAFPADASETIDTDNDGVGNNADLDDDGDGVLDVSDAFPRDASEWADFDGDGIGDNADPNTVADNVAPIAYAVSISADPSISFIEQNLVASDPDGDTIVYELVSEEAGAGYTLAYVSPDIGTLYVTIAADYVGTLNILYRVTDGQLFSETAQVEISVGEITTEDDYLGAEDVAPRTYAGFEIYSIGGELLGIPGEDAVLPARVDLSSNFPTAGNQGAQGSCVGWAVGYALKTYQEKLENAWSLNTFDHIFSPSFIYNQIKGGDSCDAGSSIHKALQMIVDQGAATWSAMPYYGDEFSCLTQPTTQIREDANNFRASRWAKVDSTRAAKAALVNRLPVVLGIDVYQPLKNLKGSSSVYNTAEGALLGGHAVTVVGYDDDQFGGAFHVINSWGVEIGETMDFFGCLTAFIPRSSKKRIS
jgi:hypothetical protein